MAQTLPVNNMSSSYYGHPKKASDFEIQTIEQATTIINNNNNSTVVRCNIKKKLERKKSKLSNDIQVADDSSSEDEEPLTPTSSIIEIHLPEPVFLGHHSSALNLDTSVSTRKHVSAVSTCPTDVQVLTTTTTTTTTNTKKAMSISSPFTPQQIADRLQKNTQRLKNQSLSSWFTGLLKPKKSISNLFSKKQQPQRNAETKKHKIEPSGRYPFDMERSIYQQSHKKLAHPHRPLQQQVVISNMMYWYLNIIRTCHPHLINNHQPTYICKSTYQSFALPTPGTTN